jgi:hypothetical protein
MLEAHVQSTIVGRAGFSPAWRSTVLTHCHDLLAKMSRGELFEDARSDLVYTRAYLEHARAGLSALGSTPIDPGFLQELDPSESAEDLKRWPAHYIRQALMYCEFQKDLDGVLASLDHLVTLQYAMFNGARTLDAATAHARRAHQDGNEEQCFIAEVNLAAVRRWLGDPDAESWFVAALRTPRAQDSEVRRGLERRLPHLLWKTNSTIGQYPRGLDLDLDDALALKFTSPATGEAREQAAVACFAEDNFVLGRLLALQAVGSYLEEGDPGGYARALKLLQDAGAGDKRSYEDPFTLCL